MGHADVRDRFVTDEACIFTMPSRSPAAPNALLTIDLCEAGDIVDDDVCGVIEAFIVRPKRRIFQFGNGYRIDVAAAVAAHPFARSIMQQRWASVDLRRAALRAAILLARPTKV